MSVLEGIELTKTYGEGAVRVEALRGVSLRVEAGEFLSIMGPSGCGKSTLLHLIGGIDVPTSGRVLLDGSDLGSLSDTERSLIRRRKIGFVFQKMNLMPTLTAVENVALPLRMDGKPRRESEERASAALDRVGIAKRAKHYPHELSGGEQQRVAIARGLVIDPVLILADEPTGSLDSANGEQVVSLLLQCAARGQAVVIVTHDAGVAGHTSRLLRMRDGLIIDDLRAGERAFAEATAAPPGPVGIPSS